MVILYNYSIKLYFVPKKNTICKFYSFKIEKQYMNKDYGSFNKNNYPYFCWQNHLIL